MDTSTRWINDYLDPPATAEDQAELLTRAGFPLEGSEAVDGGDVRQDYEMTSNRGDCVCHLGLAREIAALSGRTLKVPAAEIRANGPPVDGIVGLTNHDHAGCPLYTARVVRGITVGPSPDWLADRLRARGDIPRNNVVDATNFVLFEYGQPAHVFDLAKLAGPEIIVRRAVAAEPFLPIGEGAAEVRLATDDLVIADRETAVAIAGVKGGALSAVTDGTTDILIEAATFDPVTVRNSSRRLNIASESSYRFERGVHPGQVDAAATRLTSLILELCGGELCDGVLTAGAPIPERRTCTMRTGRCRSLLGVSISDQEMIDALAPLGFEPVHDGDVIRCTVPVQRLDVAREIDLIEEVGRMYGHDRIPIADSLQVRVTAAQPRMLARRAVSDTLVGLDFVETVSPSLVAREAAEAFLPTGAGTIRVEDDRAGGEPILRPSVIPSLLRVYRHNRDNGVTNVRLFESAATYLRRDGGHEEVVTLGLVCGMTTPEDGLRPIRGIVERLVQLLLGADAQLDVAPDDTLPWLAPGSACSVAGERLGWIGVLATNTTAAWSIDETLLAAEVALPRLYDDYPPETEAHSLPGFPAIERDVTADVPESVSWGQTRRVIDDLTLDNVEDIEFVTVYRGTPVEPGRKSLTLRVRFRAATRTLTHDEVDPEVKAIVQSLESRIGATMRS